MTAQSLTRLIAHWAIKSYQLTLSGLSGRQCRYLPTCSDYTDQTIATHGLWFGSWMGAARICRCQPLGGSGYDPPAKLLRHEARWFAPWRAADWRTPNAHERARRAADKA